MSDWPIFRTYDADHLKEIMMPIGGIGTGFFGLSGRGAMGTWEIMSRPSRNWRPMYSHLAVWCKGPQGATQVRILEDDIAENLTADFGQGTTLAGFPRMKATKFEAAYPFGKAHLSDKEFPISATIEGFNPLIPKDLASSSLPFGLMTVELTNTSNEPLEVSLTALFTNFIGADGHVFELKDNITEGFDTQGWSGMRWEKARKDPTGQNGTMALLFDQKDVKLARRWKFRDRPWSGEQLGIFDELIEKGYINDETTGDVCPPSPKDTWDSSISAMCTIPAKGKKTIRLMIAWHFPNRDLKALGWWGGGEKESPLAPNVYAKGFADAMDVASKVIPRLDSLRSRSVAFVKEVAARKAPAAMKEAALFVLAHLKTHTVFRINDDESYGFEGCGSGGGCCSGTCTHVWNYEEATIGVFPELHRGLIEGHLKHGVTDSGAERFRVSLPVTNQTWNGAAADGQMGLIVRCYQQHKAEGSSAWLQKFWPKIKSMMEYAWLPGGWDADQDGVMEGIQHNTYDVEFIGPNPLCTGWYLAALAAEEKMAEAMGDGAFAAKCKDLRSRGSKWMDENLYNGRFYIQRTGKPPEKPAALSSLSEEFKTAEPRWQLGAGCLIDQLLGQYKANCAGLGDLLDAYHIKNALKSVFRYNYKENLRDHLNFMRVYAVGDDGGTIICTYPDGERPAFPFPYWPEIWTSMEYQLAATMLDYGLVKEATKVVATTRARHDGKRRNPFNEPECGSWYARPLASWALLDAWDRANG